MGPGATAAFNIGTNLNQAFQQRNDENAIESILSQAMQSEDPRVVQDSIGKILSSVSPQNQDKAVRVLQQTYQNLQARQSEQNKINQERASAKQAGYTYGVPPQVAAQQVKDKAKAKRLSQYGLDQSQTADTQTPIENRSNIKSPVESVFKKLNDDQLVVASGAADREVSEPAKAELKRRDEERKLDETKNKNWTKFGMERAKKVLDRSEEISQALPVKKTALKLMTDAVANKNLEFWSPDNFAELTGIEAFRSPEGALFKTAGKEYFLGNISRAGSRPNQWIEQQILDMMTKIGRSTEANLSVSRALQNETDIDEERVRLTEDIFNRLRREDKDVGELGALVNKELSKFAEEKQNELFNDLRAIKSIGEGKPQKFMSVKQGTKISNYMVEALLKAYNNDPEKAAEKAKKLGYSFE